MIICVACSVWCYYVSFKKLSIKENAYNLVQMKLDCGAQMLIFFSSLDRVHVFSWRVISCHALGLV